MRFDVALLALASAVAAQTVGFDVVQKPAESESVPAGAAYTIEWTPSPQDKGTVSLTLLAGSSPQSLQVLELLKTGVDSTGGKYSWDVPSTLAEKSVYGIKISLDADPSTFQYSFPFRVVGGTPGKAAATTAASSTAAAASTSASAAKSTSTSTSSVSSRLSSSSTSTAASTSAVAPVSSAPPASSVQTHPKTSTLVTSIKTTATGTSTGRTTATVATTTATAASTTETASLSSTVSATPSAVTTSGGVAGQTVSLATLLCGLALAYAAL